MKEIVIGFLVALVVGSYLNSGGPTPFQGGWNLSNAPIGAPDPVDDVNAGNFQGEVLDSHTPILAEFYTNGDSHSENMKEIVRQLAAESQGFVKVVKINGDTNQLLVQRYDVKSYPYFVVFKEGKAVNGTSGEMQKKELEEWVKKELDIPVSN
jgi:thioredoxin-like negative regulator of GroEL